jgi:CubicO group peptidase (beta-lactamase class C family)
MLSVITVVMIAAVSACTFGPTAPQPAAALSSDIGAFLARFDEQSKVRAVLIAQGDAPVYELWRGEHAHDYVNVRSITATVMSMLIGIAIDEGYIEGVTSHLGELLPDYRAEMSPDVAAIPLNAILSNTAGFAVGGSMPFDDELDLTQHQDWVRAIIADRNARGASDWSFAYSDAGAHLLAAILTEATGGSVLDFARSKLFEPLGIPSTPAWVEPQTGPTASESPFARDYSAADFAWPTDPQGIQQGDSMLKLRPDDLLTLGRLYAQDGRRVVSDEWVQASMVARVETGRTPPEFGYGWWVDRTQAYRIIWALAYGGTVLAVVPERDLVVVVVSDYDALDPSDFITQFYTGEAVTLVQYVILPKVGDL